ncbi:hypothetical protein ACJX0J_018464, partial [Zea mays]
MRLVEWFTGFWDAGVDRINMVSHRMHIRLYKLFSIKLNSLLENWSYLHTTTARSILESGVVQVYNDWRNQLYPILNNNDIYGVLYHCDLVFLVQNNKKTPSIAKIQTG